MTRGVGMIGTGAGAVSRRAALRGLGGGLGWLAALSACPISVAQARPSGAERGRDSAEAARLLKSDLLSRPDSLRSSSWLAPSSAGSFDLPGVDRAIGDAGFLLFLAGSQIFVSNRATANPIVGLYNPVIDSWWLTLWERDERVIAAKFLPAPLFPGGATPPAWRLPIANLAPRQTLIETVQRAIRRARVDFRGELALDGRGGNPVFNRIAVPAAAAGELAGRIGRIATGVARFSNDRRARAAYVALVAALAEDAAQPDSGLSAQAAAAFPLIAALPPGERATLVPVAAWQIDGTWLVVSASGMSMGTLILAAITPGAPSPIHRLTVIAPAGADQ